MNIDDLTNVFPEYDFYWSKWGNTDITNEELKELFTKPYGFDAPVKQKWAKFYNNDVIFIDFCLDSTTFLGIVSL